MEIKTCEEYVLARLNDVELELEETKRRLLEAQAENTLLAKKVMFIREFLSVQWTYDNSSLYVSFDNVWQKHYPEKYRQLVNLFELQEPEPHKPEETIDTN